MMSGAMTSDPKIATVRAVSREPGTCARKERTSSMSLRASSTMTVTSATALISRIQACRLL
jgi:hypothetical protein